MKLGQGPGRGGGLNVWLNPWPLGPAPLSPATENLHGCNEIRLAGCTHLGLDLECGAASRQEEEE